jgi:arylsulfatase
MKSMICGALILATMMMATVVMAQDKPPNILYIMADQFRNDILDEANHIHTPNLQYLISQGVRFTHAYASTPICTPSRAALLTGLSPWNHGMLGKAAHSIGSCYSYYLICN